MQIIIDISEDYYKDIQSRDWKNPIWADEVTRAIHEGTVLPENCGAIMKCMECKHFERLKDGMRGGIKGSCKLRNTSSYHDIRYGNQKACKTYFEPQERSNKE